MTASRQDRARCVGGLTMPILGKPAGAAAAGLVMLAVGPATASIAAPRAAESPPAVAGGTSASAPPASIDLTFDGKNRQSSLDGQFNPAGITTDDGDQPIPRSGTMDAVYLGGLVFLLGVSGRTPLDAVATNTLTADAAVITGDAEDPAGATVPAPR